MEIEEQEFVLNIPHDMHEEDWKDLFEAYQQLPGWMGLKKDGCAYWFSEEEENHVKASVSFTGLVLNISLPENIWKKWMVQFMRAASDALGYQVKIIG